MRIAELAARTGVPPRLLRYYEDQGLLCPQRDSKGWRVYDASDARRVDEVRSLIGAGLPTAAIAKLLGRNDTPSHPSEVSAELRAELRAVLDRLDSRIQCLSRNRDALASWLQALPV